jgi:predicted amidohydrolase YtcJ
MSTIVFTGARVWVDEARFEERTLWVSDGRVAALGGRGAPDTGGRDDIRVLDFSGKYIMPSFVDAHFHLMALAGKALRCDLSEARNARDVVALLDAWIGAHPGDEPVVGVDFDESTWDDPALPSRGALNGVATDRPVYARRICGHVGVGNDAMLRQLAKIPPIASFVDNESGRIVEGAVFEANRITRPPQEVLAGSVDGAIAQLHAMGVTAIHDIVDESTIDTYVEGLENSERPLRLDAYVHLPAADFDDARDRLEEASGINAAGIKIFADGSLGGRTAALHQPYADGTGTGDLLVTKADLVRELTRCRQDDIACAVHAIGDHALSTVLEAMSEVGTGDARFRIEHAEIIGERELDACARLGVPLVMQPNFVRNWGGEGGLYEQRLGRERWQHNNRFASLLSAGVPFIFSSDVMPAGPLYGIRGATHHPVAAERIGPAEALRRYTTAASHLWGGDDDAHGIDVGAPADLVVLSGNPLFADVDGLTVEATYVGGWEVYRNRATAPRNHANRRR